MAPCSLVDEYQNPEKENMILSNGPSWLKFTNVSTTLGEAPCDQHNKPPLVSCLWNGIAILQRFLGFFFLFWRFGARPPHCWVFEIILRHIAFGSTPLSDGSAQRRDLYLKLHNTYKIQDTHAPGGIGTRNQSKPAAADPRLYRRRGYRDRRLFTFFE
jgi:hypothetical protein